MTAKVRGVVFCSGSASSLRYLHQNDPNFGEKYQIVGLFSNVPDVSGITYAREIGTGTKVLNFYLWCHSNGIGPQDLTGRRAYFAQILDMIAEWKPDFIMLSGFMLLVTDPLLSSYQGRILNVHPALLSLVNRDGSRRYTGLNVVARAMAAHDPTGSQPCI